MALTSVQPRSGIYKRTTDFNAEGRWTDGNLVRFVGGRPAQMGGWQTITPSTGSITGVPRGALGWRNTTTIRSYAAFGTASGLYVYNSDKILDITPAGYTTGRTDSVISAGYGMGAYGAGAYGTARSGSNYTLQATVWTFDTFGDYLIGCANTDGDIYEWDGSAAQATVVTNAPTSCQAVAVTDERFVVAIGAGGDPRKIQWSDKGDRTTWTPATTNKAGSLTLVDTGRVMCARKIRGQLGIWTETRFHGMFWQPGPYVYGIEAMGDNCGILGPNSVAVADGIPYWMGVNSFYTFNGAVKAMDCDVQEHVFNDLNLLQRHKAHAYYNQPFNEVWFFYVSADSTEIDKYVILNLHDGSWSIGELDRTAFVQLGAFDDIVGANSSGTIYTHEDGDLAEGLGDFIESAPFDLDEGHNILRVKSIVPDFQLDSDSAIVLYVKTKLHPQASTTTTSDALEVLPTTERIYLRQLGRQAALRIEGDGGYWKMGKPRFDVEAGGPR
jgi:hypothetical protein